MSGINDVTVTDLVKSASSDAIQSWSDTRKIEFKKTFEERTRVAQYLLSKTAQLIREGARTRKFVSHKHQKAFDAIGLIQPNQFYDKIDRNDYYNRRYTVCGRPVEELDDLAEIRAKDTLKELPPLLDAVRIMSPEIAKAMEERDRLVEICQSLVDRLDELSDPISTEDLPESTTIGEFKAMVKQRRAERKALVDSLDEYSKQGRELDTKIDKALYAGLPGLSEAVIKVYSDYAQRVVAFSTMERRVGEQVMFGDSEAALGLLKTFEKDETVVSENIKTEFAAALEVLKVRASTVRKEKRAAQLKESNE